MSTQWRTGQGGKRGGRRGKRIVYNWHSNECEREGESESAMRRMCSRVHWSLKLLFNVGHDAWPIGPCKQITSSSKYTARNSELQVLEN